MPAEKRKLRNTPPRYDAPTQASNAKRVKLPLPLRQGPRTLKPGPGASKTPTAPKGILRTKRPREDDDKEGPDPKRQVTLCSRLKVQPNQAPNGNGLDELGKEHVGVADCQDSTSAEQITTTSTKPKDDLGGNEESMAQGEPVTQGKPVAEGDSVAEGEPVESKTAPFNDKSKRPTVEPDLNDEWTDERASNSYPVDLESQDDDGSGNEASVDVESLDNDSLSSSSSDSDSLANSSSDNDNDSTNNSSPIAHHTSHPPHHPSTNRTNPIFSNQTLTSQNLPSDTHLSRCEIVSCNACLQRHNAQLPHHQLQHSRLNSGGLPLHKLQCSRLLDRSMLFRVL